jgi:hypothetical protein
MLVIFLKSIIDETLRDVNENFRQYETILKRFFFWILFPFISDKRIKTIMIKRRMRNIKCFANLAREYSSPEYFEIHRLTVDAYAAQHPGQPSPQSIKSVGYHLVRLCLLLERGLEMQRANEAMLSITKTKEHFIWLTPPSSLGSITVSDVCKASSAEEHKQLVRLWAASVWAVWSPHHSRIYSWLPILK